MTLGSGKVRQRRGERIPENPQRPLQSGYGKRPDLGYPQPESHGLHGNSPDHLRLGDGGPLGIENGQQRWGAALDGLPLSFSLSSR